jgi:hypothetical protein
MGDGFEVGRENQVQPSQPEESQAVRDSHQVCSRRIHYSANKLGGEGTGPIAGRFVSGFPFDLSGRDHFGRTSREKKRTSGT